MELFKGVLTALNDLLTRNYDAEKGYREAGNGVNDARLREWLFKLSDQRAAFQQELKYEIKDLEGAPDEGSSVLADLHRVWLDPKSDVLSDPVAVLEECRRGEERALEDYRKVLTQVVLPKPTRLVLESQFAKIRLAFGQVKDLMAAYEQVG